MSHTRRGRTRGPSGPPIAVDTSIQLEADADDGWSKRLSKKEKKRRKHGNAPEDTSQNQDGSQANASSHDPAQSQTSSKRRRRNRKRNRRQSSQGASDPITVDTANGENNMNIANEMAPDESDLLNVLLQTFKCKKIFLKQIIQELNLTSYDEGDFALKDAIHQKLIEKQTQELVNFTEDESEADRAYENEEDSKLTELVTAGGKDEEKEVSNEMNEEEESELVGEDSKMRSNAEQNQNTGEQKPRSRAARRRAKRRKRKQQQSEEETQPESRQDGMMMQSEPNSVIESSGGDAEMNVVQQLSPKDVLMSELNRFLPTDDSAVDELLKWKTQFENDSDFAVMFEECLGLERMIEKLIYCDTRRGITCQRELVDILDVTLQGSHNYHEWLIRGLIDVCHSISIFTDPKAASMKHRLSELCKEMFSAHKKSNLQECSLEINVMNLKALERASEAIPAPQTQSDLIVRKISNIDIQKENLDLVEHDLIEQQKRMEQMRPTSNPKFRNSYANVRVQLTKELTGINTRRKSLADKLYHVESKKQKIMDNTSHQLVPLEQQLQTTRDDVERLSNEKMQLEKQLQEINLRLDRLRSEEQMYADQMTKINALNEPMLINLKKERDDYQFEMVRVDKESKCYEKLRVLCDESWNKLNEWSESRIKTYENESDNLIHRYLEQLTSYLESFAQLKTFLVDRINKLTNHITNAKKKKAEMQHYFGNEVSDRSNDEITFYAQQIDYDKLALEKAQEKIQLALQRGQKMVPNRTNLYYSFLHNLKNRTNNILNLNLNLGPTSVVPMSNGIYDTNANVSQVVPQSQVPPNTAPPSNPSSGVPPVLARDNAMAAQRKPPMSSGNNRMSSSVSASTSSASSSAPSSNVSARGVVPPILNPSNRKTSIGINTESSNQPSQQQSLYSNMPNVYSRGQARVPPQARAPHTRSQQPTRQPIVHPSRRMPPHAYPRVVPNTRNPQ